VERPDTPQIRGLLAKVPHLVEVVEEASPPSPWARVPEYTVGAVEIAPAGAAIGVEQLQSEAPGAEAAEGTPVPAPTELVTASAESAKPARSARRVASRAVGTKTADAKKPRKAPSARAAKAPKGTKRK